MRIRWNIRGFEELRRSPGIESKLQGEVDRVLDSVGGEYEGYSGGVSQGRTRSRGYVVAFSPESVADNATNHTLLRALMAGKEV